MCVFFRFRNTELGQSLPAYDFPNGFFHFFLIKKNVKSFECVVVWSKATIVQGNGVHFKLRHVFLGKNPGDLTGPVVPEIEKNQGIVFFKSPYRNPGFIHTYQRFYEFICDTLFITLFYSVGSIGKRHSLAMDYQIIPGFYPVPSFVPVHGIITSDHTGDFSRGGIHVFLQFFNISLAAERIGVPSVHKAMYIDFGQTVLRSNVQKRKKMFH